MSEMDLCNLGDGLAEKRRTSFYYDHPYAHGGKLPTTIGVRTRTHTYTRYTSGSPVLKQIFGNAVDPDQLNNLALDPGHRDLFEQLRRDCNQLQQQVQS